MLVTDPRYATAPACTEHVFKMLKVKVISLTFSPQRGEQNTTKEKENYIIEKIWKGKYSGNDEVLLQRRVLRKSRKISTGQTDRPLDSSF